MRLVGRALVVALVYASSCTTTPLATPTPTPTPSPIAVSPSPTDTPTATAPPSPSATDTATATIAPPPPPPPPPPPSTGSQIADVWRTIRAQYPWLPDVRPEATATGAPDAYLGLTPEGYARVAYQEGGTVGADGGIVWHESGHCVIDVASRLSGTTYDVLMTAYWIARGYPGTWQLQQQRADLAKSQGVGGFALHQMLPNEMFADTFAASNIATWPDGDQFKVPLDKAKLKAFYASIPFLLTGSVNAWPATLSGDVVLFSRVDEVRDASGAVRPPAIGEVWAIPFAGGPARRVVTYVTGLTTLLRDTNVLTQALSPDARRLALSAGVPGAGGALHDALLVVDLAAGTARVLDGDPAYHDLYPAWSPDGSKIAFARRFAQDPPFDSGLWLVNADGSGLRQLVETDPHGATAVFGWTPDGAGIGWDASESTARYTVYDLKSGTTASRMDGTLQLPAPAAWRAATPRYVAAASRDPGAPTQIVVADGLGAPTRVIAGPDPGFTLSRPRWAPKTDDVLFVRTLNDYSELYRQNATATDGRIASRIVTLLQPQAAAWSLAGDEVAYVGSSDLLAPLALHRLKVDGSGEQELAPLPLTSAALRNAVRDLTLRRYP